MTISFVQGSGAPTVTAGAVSGRHQILVICNRRELADLEEAEAFRGPGQRALRLGCWVHGAMVGGQPVNRTTEIR
jgi:hypothetical protein